MRQDRRASGHLEHDALDDVDQILAAVGDRLRSLVQILPLQLDRVLGSHQRREFVAQQAVGFALEPTATACLWDSGESVRRQPTARSVSAAVATIILAMPTPSAVGTSILRSRSRSTTASIQAEDIVEALPNAEMTGLLREEIEESLLAVEGGTPSSPGGHEDRTAPRASTTPAATLHDAATVANAHRHVNRAARPRPAAAVSDANV